MWSGFCASVTRNDSSMTSEWRYGIVSDCWQYLLVVTMSGLFNVVFVACAVARGLRRDCCEGERREEGGELDCRYMWKMMSRVLLTALVIAEGGALTARESGGGRNLIGEIDPLMATAFASLAVSLIMVIILTEFRRRTMYPISPLMFMFWLSVTLTYFVRFYSHIIRFIIKHEFERNFLFIFFSGIIFLLCFLNLILECFQLSSQRSVRKKRMECPEECAPILSQLLYVWLDKFIYRWYKDEMTEETAFNIRWMDECTMNTNLVENIYLKKILQHKGLPVTCSTSDDSKFITDRKHLDGKKIRPVSILLFILMKSFGLNLVVAWSMKIINDVAIYLMPFILKLLLQTVQEKAMSNCMGYVFAFAFLICGIISNLCVNYCFFITSSTSIQIRAALIGMIYRKIFKLKNETRNKFSSGEIINLMSVDADRIMNSVVYSWFIISFPLQFTLAIMLLYQEMGNAIFAGLGVIVLFFPLNGILMVFQYRFSDTELKWKDDRVRILTEILNGIKVLKMYAWETSFLSKVTRIRNKEMNYNLRGSFSYAITNVIWEILPFLILLATFLTFIYMDGTNVITAERVFVSLSLFNMLRSAVIMLPWCLTESVSAFVSLKRIGEYLLGEEFEKNESHDFHDPIEKCRSTFSDDSVVKITEGYFSWKRDEKIILSRINIEIAKGRLVAIVGKVGTGKSSLISAILGEMHTISGSVKIRGKIAYVSQEAWIQNKSLKDNILFTKKYNEELYKKVIKSCALERDLDQLPGRDETEIGERGINLSGGQKQRVSLARSVYQNRDIYLLDDPLSAVDAHVGEYLFENVISNNGILNGKTRILVTHGLNWLPKVDEVFVLDNNGHISERGLFKDLLKNGADFMQFIQENMERMRHRTESSYEFETEEEANIKKADILLQQVSVSNQAVDDFTELIVSSPKKHNILTEFTEEPSTNSRDCLFLLSETNDTVLQVDKVGNINTEAFDEEQSTSDETPKSKDSDPVKDRSMKLLTQLIDDEEAMLGTVKWATYLMYLKSRGILLFVLSVLMYMSFVGIQIYSNIWLQWFTSDVILQNASAEVLKNHSNADAIHKMQTQTQYYILRYTYIGLGMTFAVSLFWISFAIGSFRASKVIHKVLLYAIFRSPIRFFDTTPSGRIINRFSKDMEVTDHSIPVIIGDFINCFFIVLGSIVVTIYVTPWFVTIIIPLLILYYFIQVFYMPTSRQSRRLDSIASSPVFNHFTESLQGISLIRAFNEQNYFKELNQKLIDRSNKFKFIQFSSVRWLSLRIEMLGNMIVFGSVLFAILNRNHLSVSLIGLSIACCLQVTEMLGWLFRQYTDLETNSVALERLREYSQVPSEAEWDSNNRPPESWPHLGNVVFENYELKYRDNLPLVLKKINLFLHAGEKIGVVGRTGAGKSSLNFGLFRLMEAAGGSITIDGIDIATLGLHDLRSNLTILPQEPVIFCGTIRDNLDPFNVHSDDELYQCLETAHLQQWVSTLVEGMDYDCGEGGANLSTGQKQLLCLARAVLRKSKVIILDEATASVDVETDGLVMETIREFFKESTVIIIAHRINTIVDADKVVVMEDGEVVEFGEPKKLLSNPKSVFKSLYDQSSSGDL